MLTDRECQIVGEVFAWAVRAVADTCHEYNLTPGIVAEAILDDDEWLDKLKAKLESAGY